MADQIHTFIIEIPSELDFNEKDIKKLEGRFVPDAGIVIDEKQGIQPDEPFTNTGAVKVIFRVQPPAERTSGEECSAPEEG